MPSKHVEFTCRKHHWHLVELELDDGSSGVIVLKFKNCESVLRGSDGKVKFDEFGEGAVGRS